MKREIRVINQEKKIVQITLQDERWYQIEDKFVPSVTWISGFYPKGIQFYKWLANKGWDESEAIKTAAGDKGSKVHFALEDLLSGKEVKIDSKYLNKSTGQKEELTTDEYYCIMTFAKWHESVKPETINCEIVVLNEEEGYAGTVDLVCKIGEDTYIVDFKTGQYIWPEYELQLSAYKYALDKNYKTAILQVGYRKNKNGYKFTEIPDKYDLFLGAKKVWNNECSKIQPLQRDYPLSIKL